MEKITSSEKETREFGQKIARDLLEGDILCLYGELGAGKTALTKGIALGLGIKKEITSPTFTLMNIYDKLKTPKTKIKTLVHIDTYRLKNEEELLDIGVEDFLGAPNTICIIEWPEKMENLLRGKKVTEIKIEHTNKRQRKIIMNRI